MGHAHSTGITKLDNSPYIDPDFKEISPYVKLQANAQSVDLSARTFYKPESSSAEYLNYGVGASEVNLIANILNHSLR